MLLAAPAFAAIPFGPAIEQALPLTMGLVCAGEPARAGVSDVWLFGLLSVVCLEGMGNAAVPARRPSADLVRSEQVYEHP